MLSSLMTKLMEEERVLLDSICNLPQEIHRRIVSLIPLKESVRTSILSTAWRSLWAPFRVELLDSEYFHSNQILDLLLKPCDTAELWKFILRRSGPSIYDEEELVVKQGFKIKEDLSFLAARGGEKELLLDFFGGKKTPSNFNLILDPICPIDQMAKFSSLKSLHLRSVHEVSKRLASDLLFSCRVIESLKLEKCTGLENINLTGSRTLENFSVADCPDVASVTLRAISRLKSFHYRGVLPRIRIENSPELVDVVLDLREGLGEIEFDCEEVLSLLAALRDTQFLRVSGWLIEWLSAAGVIFGQLQFKFNQLKELCWFDSLISQPKRDSLACFLDMSPLLERLVIKIDQNLSSISCPCFLEYWHEPYLWMDYATVKSNASQLEHLKVVEMVGFSTANIEEDQLLLMDLLLKKAAGTLKCLAVVSSSENQPWQVTKLPRSQLRHTSGCLTKQFTVISSPDNDYFFRLSEE